MREKPRPRHHVSSTALALLRPLFRFSTARDAYVLRIAGGRYGPVLVDKTEPTPEEARPAPKATGRFTRGTEPARDDPPVTQTRQR